MGVSRREFCLLAGGALGTTIAPPLLSGLDQSQLIDVDAIDRTRVLRAAGASLNERPITITSASSPRSAGGQHDYFSEGDYWWPVPKEPNAPYIRRDGMSNPDNFVAHREALIRLSLQMPALAAAWKMTHERKYAEHAASHLRAWFIDPETKMNPNLQYAQAIPGITIGRGTGIIDTLHLVEVARATQVLQAEGALDKPTIEGTRKWFADYLEWMTTAKNGIEERDAQNNHGTCWVLQVAAFAQLIGNEELVTYACDRYKTVLLPAQMKSDGSFPLELARTKPYSYSLLNLDVMTTLCWTVDTMHYQMPDGRGIDKAIAFMYPYIRNKNSWPYPHDVEYFDDLPVRQANLLFGGLAFAQRDYLALWRRLNPDPSVTEIIRNFPVRQPVLWVG